VADTTSLTDAERAKLEARRDRLMKLMNEGGSDLDAEDRADLMQEWQKIDNILTHK
jgi:flagellar biosynthesis/type III secretory pathway chaperone